MNLDSSVRPVAHYREAGNGPTVLCIHGIASSSAQWRSLMSVLAESHRVIATDLYGDGGSPPCPPSRELSFDDEVALIEPLLEGLDRFHLIGHSYGGCVAIKLCLKDPARVASMVLYEPALWGMLVDLWPEDPGAKEIMALRAETCALVDAGAVESAAEKFVDYWGGAGTWLATPDSRKPSLLAGTVTGTYKWQASPGLSVSPGELTALAVPVLVLTGSETTQAARSLMRRLGEAVPKLRIVELQGLGHMGPMTHPALVNAEIKRFLQTL